MKPYFQLIIFGSLSLFLSACQTSDLKKYENLQVGMDKGTVLSIMGSPSWSERWHGQDRWSYRFYEDKTEFRKEVHFLEGKASYIGDIYKPAISAEEQDRMNEELNQKFAAEDKKKRDENRIQTNQYLDNESAKTEIRYVPQFRPIQ